MHFALIILLLVTQDPLPYKPSEEFEVKLDFELKAKPGPDHQKVNLDPTVSEYNRIKAQGPAPLPYVTVNIHLQKLPANERRVKVYTNGGKLVLSKKVTEGQVLPLELGFTDDMKDRVSPHEYTAIFYNAEKDAVNRVVIFIDKTGDYLVNNEKRGRF